MSFAVSKLRAPTRTHRTWTNSLRNNQTAAKLSNKFRNKEPSLRISRPESAGFLEAGKPMAGVSNDIRFQQLQREINHLKTEARYKYQLEVESQRTFDFLTKQVTSLKSAFQSLSEVIVEELDEIRNVLSKREKQSVMNGRQEQLGQALGEIERDNMKTSLSRHDENLQKLEQKLSTFKFHLDARLEEETARTKNVLIRIGKAEHKMANTVDEIKNLVSSNSDLIQANTELFRAKLHTPERLLVPKVWQKITELESSVADGFREIQSELSSAKRSHLDVQLKLEALELGLFEHSRFSGT